MTFLSRTVLNSELNIYNINVLMILNYIYSVLNICKLFVLNYLIYFYLKIIFPYIKIKYILTVYFFCFIMLINGDEILTCEYIAKKGLSILSSFAVLFLLSYFFQIQCCNSVKKTCLSYPTKALL